ncbi:hypothetical protein P170DRAFT_5928 [Aspergillus steynii IBT 23096]|uniref:Uncharacterized protein n=1 Tax=Aspergillus steynii IBT 23096 TaxID=1392250 RepID=A0A2I2GLY9_9EURO|nr:uncharacterized protein P170DRAFT_5928 [Aspergillus steynii IBT 23096]PLB53892.1 hypothetical protein P170DRAFT_5928 [Aspergillus steynii IBT 23096]
MQSPPAGCTPRCMLYRVASLLALVLVISIMHQWPFRDLAHSTSPSTGRSRSRQILASSGTVAQPYGAIGHGPEGLSCPDRVVCAT